MRFSSGISQPCQDASHIGKAVDYAGHRIVGMNLILEIDEAFVLCRDQRFEHLPHRHDALSYRDLALLALKIRQVLHVHVEQPRSGLADRLHHIRAGASGVPDINAAADARIHTLDRLQYIQRRMPQLVLGPVIVDCDTDVVFLYEFLNSRQSLRRGIAGDDDRDPRSLAVFELGPDVGIFILGKIDGARGVQPDARGGIVRQRCGFLLRDPSEDDL